MRFSSSAPATDITDRLARLLGLTRGDVQRALFNSQSFTGVADQAAVGTDFSRVQIRNPVGSGVLTVVYGALIWVGAAMDVRFRIAGVALATSVKGVNNRIGGAASATDINKDTTNVTQAFTHGVVAVPASPSFFLSYPSQALWVLPEGQDVTLSGFTINVELKVTFHFLELNPTTTI